MNSDSPGSGSPKFEFHRGKHARYGGWLDLALQMALTLAIAVLVGLFGGRWLDSRLDTTPWMTILGVLWGAGGGTAWVVIKIKQYGDAREREESEGKDLE